MGIFTRNNEIAIQSAEIQRLLERIARGETGDELHAPPDPAMAGIYRALAAVQQRVRAETQTQRLNEALKDMARQHGDGWIDRTIDVAAFAGVHQEIARSINDLVHSHIDVKMQVVDVITHYGRGDFSVDMARLPGQKAKITEAIDQVKQGLLGAARVLDELQRGSAENLRIKNALDNVSTNVMIADNDRNIIYMNRTVEAMLVSAETDIRKQLPQFDARRLIGTNIDGFHKNPAHQRGMLATFSSTYRTQIQIGGRTFGLIANPIIDEKGDRLGSVVEWADRTAEVAAEAEAKRLQDEMARIKNALDNVSTNVMIGDNDLRIVYLNRSVQAMLTRAEADIRKAVPHFNAAKLLGANVDVFHKNPSHQRQLLSALSNTYSTQITVGGRTFALTANPIVNAQGERLGTVVEWKDRTGEVAVEQEVGGIVQAATRGDFTTRVELGGKEGFFRQLAEGINQLLDTSSVGLNEVVRMLGALAKGDLTEKITNHYEGTFGELKNDANATAEKLKDIVARIKESTDTINTAAKEIAVGNADLSQRTEEQASSLEETASSMEELTSTVKQNAENAKQANQLAKGASDIAVRGGHVVSKVVDTMDAITDSSKKIVDIISVIDGIAFQTNILALNAAVEAARAGEQGRGFAVVAAEVRNLAQRSAAAAKEIKSLISDSVAKVENGSKLVANAGTTMEEIVEAVKRVTDIMAEISAASIEQSAGIEQVNQAVTQMDEATQQNAALVEQAAAAAESMEEQAQTMADLVAVFKLDQTAVVLRGAAPRADAHRPAQSRPAPAPGGPRPQARKALAAKPARPAKSAGAAHEDEWDEF